MRQKPDDTEEEGSIVSSVLFNWLCGIMSLEFEWDPAKSVTNLRKHKVTFQEASTVFEDLYGITVPDPDHSDDEDRYLIVGQSGRGRLLIVSFAERAGRLRIISARMLTQRERKQYEEAQA
jgi:uncharacterized DUF497 family protein